MQKYILPKNTKTIEKGMVGKDANYLLIPKSVQLIKKDALVFEEYRPDQVYYEGTVKEWSKIKVEEGNRLTNINCKDGMVILAI